MAWRQNLQLAASMFASSIGNIAVKEEFVKNKTT